MPQGGQAQPRDMVGAERPPPTFVGRADRQPETMLNAKWRPLYERLRRRSRVLDAGIRHVTRPAWAADSSAAIAMLAARSALAALDRARPPVSQRPKGKLRVLFLTAEGEAVAPARIRCYRFAEELRRRGHEAEVFSFWQDIWHIEGIPPRRHLAIERIAAALKAYDALKDRAFDVVYQQRPTYDLATTALLHWTRGTPVAFDIDDWIFDYEVLRPYRVHRVLAHLRRLSETCVVSSELLREAVSGHFNHVHLLPTFVDTNAFRPRSARPPGPVVFGWNGTVFQDFMAESLRLLIDAFADAAGRVGGRADVVLDLVGQGSYLPEVERWFRAKYPGLPVRVRGWIEPSRMNEYLDGIDVGLYALSTPKYDPAALYARGGGQVFVDQLFLRSKSPTKVFEYMAKGLPVVSTSTGEAGHTVEDGQTGFVCDSREALAVAFERLALDESLRQAMGQRARARAEERYSLAHAGEALESILMSVVAKRPTG